MRPDDLDEETIEAAARSGAVMLKVGVETGSPKLAEEMGITTHYLSNILNNVIHNNFYEVVNKYRGEEVKNKLARNEDKRFTLLAIALESGFNSKASFNRIFILQCSKDLTPKLNLDHTYTLNHRIKPLRPYSGFLGLLPRGKF